MRIISTMMSILIISLLFGPAWGEIITKLPVHEKVVALTFDACETKSPSFLDQRILRFVLEQQIPCSIFVSGKFANRNRDGLQELAKQPFIRIENHSLSHFQHMEKLSPPIFESEIIENDQLIFEISDRRPLFFRFPAGNYDKLSVNTAEALGYRVVHWTFPSGDPDRRTTPERLVQWVLSKVRSGSILIFHINGRGYSTGDALPRIVHEMKLRGYRFVALEEALGLKVENPADQIEE